MGEHKSLKLILEAMLFASETPKTARELQALLPDAALADIRDALERLKADYAAMERSFVLSEIASGYQFKTRPEYARYVLQMLKAAPTRLSRAGMETLAIIAYRQPILRHEIEKLRGVDAAGSLKTLLEKGLIRIVGRKDLPGRPLLYGTTHKFLEVFDLKDLNSLPKLKEIMELEGTSPETAGPAPTEAQGTPHEPKAPPEAQSEPQSEPQGDKPPQD